MTKLDQANHINTYTKGKISGMVDQQIFFDVLELNGIKLSDKNKSTIFTMFNSGNNINERLQPKNNNNLKN